MSKERELHFVRLREEEVTEILTSTYDMYSTICAVENRLAEKNHPPQPSPARKPMTPKERLDGYIELEGTIGSDAHLMSFLSGICAAEKHHFGIGGDE